MYHFLINFCLFTCLMMSSSIAQNSKDVTIKWGSPVSHFFESEEVKALSFDGAFYNLHESSFPLYQEKIRLPQNVSQVEVDVDVLETSALLSSEKNLASNRGAKYNIKLEHIIRTKNPLSYFYLYPYLRRC